MVYDMTDKNAIYPFDGVKGYAIHKDLTASNENITVYEIYTDDGAGNGDYVCSTSDKFWADRISKALDSE